MAVDSALLDGLVRGSSQPVVRLYRWSRPSVTLGMFQEASKAVHIEFCAAHGVEVIRRPTGGRGVLHGGDQTVTFVLPDALIPHSSSVLETYRALTAPLTAALRSIGVDARQGPQTRTTVGCSGDCFSATIGGDIVGSDGSKLVGVALRRSHGHVLAQASIRHRATSVASCDVFRGPAATESFPISFVSTDDLEAVIVRSLVVALGCPLDHELLTGEEYAAAIGIRSNTPGCTLIDTRSGM